MNFNSKHEQNNLTSDKHMEPIFDKLWLYNDRANISLLNSLEKQQHTQELPAKSLRLLSHIMNTQMIWLGRIRKIPASVCVWDEHDLETCKTMHLQTSTGIKTEIDSHIDMLQQTVKYKTTKGLPYEDHIDDILFHLFNHGTYHRGQIALDLRLNGLEPINTDYITFLR